MLTQAKINLLLAALVLILGALLLFEPGKDTGDGPTPLTGLGADRIHRMIRSAPSGQILTLERHGQNWTMLAPYRVAADAHRVHGLLAIAGQPSRARFPAVPEELAGFGLSPPAIRLELDGEQLGFGRTDPVYFRRYVLFRNQVHLIDDHGYRHLIASPEAFVSRRLLEPGAEILAINGPGLDLRRDGGDRWLGEVANAPDAQAMIRAWQESQALEVRKATAEAGGAAIELRLKEQERPLVFLRPSEQPDLLIRPDLGLGYRVPADSALLKVLQVVTEEPRPHP